MLMLTLFAKAISNQSSDNLISTTTTVDVSLTPQMWETNSTFKCTKYDEFDEEILYKMDKIVLIAGNVNTHKYRQDTHKG